MSDTWVGPGWWLANDGRWYPPAGPDDVVVLDLRGTEPVIDLTRSASPPLVPPPIPARTAAAAPATSAVDATERRVRTASPARPATGGGRWGRHRAVATPVDSSPTD